MAGRQGEPLVIRELDPTIPGQRLVQMVGQLLRLLDQRVDDGLRVTARDLGEHHVAGVPFDQRDEVAVLRAAQQVALPVTGDGAVRGNRHENGGQQLFSVSVRVSAPTGLARLPNSLEAGFES